MTLWLWVLLGGCLAAVGGLLLFVLGFEAFLRSYGPWGRE